ncbi:MAG: response regulator transcription factor [Bacteroidota bacterium]
MTTKTVNVWVIEDDPAYRRTLAYLLNSTPELTCGRDFGDCPSALRALQADQDPDARWSPPDVILLDINLPEMSGLEGVRHLKTLVPSTHIVMLTIRDDAKTIYEAFRSGASGYLLKGARVDELIAAILQASQGGTLMPPRVAREVLHFFQRDAVPKTDYKLTEREIEVLKEMAEGYTKVQMAKRLFVSRHTVDSHLRHIYKKLHVRSGIEAVAKAIREGLI